MRRGTEPEWQEVLEHLGVRAPRKRSARRRRAVSSNEDFGPLTPHAGPPPALTRRLCQQGPYCEHTRGHYVCACDPDEPAAPRTKTCVAMGAGADVRDDGSVGAFRCQTCALCAWEKEADRWHQVAPWNRELHVHRERIHPFTSLDAAIIAFAEWERHNRTAPSAMGPLIDKLERGDVGGGGTSYRPGRESSVLVRATDVVPVRKALERAFAARNVWSLSPVTCQVLLVASVGGVLPRKPSPDQLAESFGTQRATVKSVVYAGRRSATIELAARDVIPMPARSDGLHWEISLRRMELERRRTL